MFQCYTGLVLRNFTLTLPEEVARWVRVRAAEENVSMSKLVGRILESQMARADDYAVAHRRWQKLMKSDSLQVDTKNRLTREQANGRR